MFQLKKSFFTWLHVTAQNLSQWHLEPRKPSVVESLAGAKQRCSRVKNEMIFKGFFQKMQWSIVCCTFHFISGLRWLQADLEINYPSTHRVWKQEVRSFVIELFLSIWNYESSESPENFFLAAYCTTVLLLRIEILEILDIFGI